MPTDYDSPWKEALDLYFPFFLALLFPRVHDRIDWSRGWESLDKEFQQLTPDDASGRRFVDKLVKVWGKDGREMWVLIHVEIQTTRNAGFPRRMYVYNYRIDSRYNEQPVVSLAVLAHDDPDWRPDSFVEETWGCERRLKFPVAKLLDFAAHEAELEASDNPFAQVVLAHFKAIQTRDDAGDRHAWKIRLVRNLYRRGWTPKDVRELFRLIDWLMELPPVLDKVFWQEVDQIQEERRMPFITTPERVGIRQGLQEGIEELLRVKLGDQGVALMPEIREVYELDKLRAVLKAIGTAATPDDVRRVWTLGERGKGA